MSLIATGLPRDHKEWTIGHPDIDVSNQSHGFIPVFQGQERSFTLELWGDCRPTSVDGNPPDEEEVTAIWDAQSDAHRGHFEVDEFTIEATGTRVQGHDVLVTSWTHTSERGLEQARVTAVLSGGPEGCVLRAPGGDSDHGADFSWEAVAEFAPILLTLLETTGEAAPYDAEALLGEIEEQRSSAGPGNLVGFVLLNGLASTGLPEDPIQPICRGAGDFDHIIPGVEIAVRRDDGPLVVITDLRGSMFDSHHGCAMWFSAEVPQADWYTIEINGWSSASFDATQVEAGGWIIYMWSDSIALEANCGNDSEMMTCAVFEPVG